MLYIRSPEPTHLITGRLYPLTNIAFPHPPALGNHPSPLWFHEFDFFLFHTEVRSYSICLSVSALLT